MKKKQVWANFWPVVLYVCVYLLLSCDMTRLLFLLRLITLHWAAKTAQCPTRLWILMPARRLLYLQYLSPPTVPITNTVSIVLLLTIITIIILRTTITITPRVTPNCRVREVTTQLKIQVVVVTTTTMTTTINITRIFTIIISSSSSCLVSFLVFLVYDSWTFPLQWCVWGCSPSASSWVFPSVWAI